MKAALKMTHIECANEKRSEKKHMLNTEEKRRNKC